MIVYHTSVSQTVLISILPLLSIYAQILFNTKKSMYLGTVKSHTDWQDAASVWTSESMIDHSGISLELCQAIGKQASIPNNAPDQPCCHPQNSK